MNREIINRCQPGYGASCSLCCGSHNYIISPENIEDMFTTRGREFMTSQMRHPEEASAIKLIPSGMQCSNLGMLPSNPGSLCCLVYTDYIDEKDLESYFTGTCKNFYCPAWNDLSDEQVIFAARLMGDWYYYGLFINDIEAVQDMHAQYSLPDHMPIAELETLKEELWQRFIDEDGK